MLTFSLKLNIFKIMSMYILSISIHIPRTNLFNYDSYNYFDDNGAHISGITLWMLFFIFNLEIEKPTTSIIKNSLTKECGEI